MLYLEQKYISLISSQLTGCKKVGKYTYNFKCPVCGDSKSTNKKRGYLYYKHGKYSFFCHNCNRRMNLKRFLKYVNADLYKQYMLEKVQIDKPYHIKSETTIFEEKMKPPKYVSDSALKMLPKISSLPSDHPAKEYIVSRLIPNKYHRHLFYCDGFKHWINGIIPDKFKDTTVDDGRIIIPLVNSSGQLDGVQGRSLNPNDNIRYISIMFDEDACKIFNLDKIDPHKKIYVFEGPFDAMFIENSVARCGGHIQSVEHVVPKNKCVLVYDNEPRNKEVGLAMEKAIIAGYRICIWPKDMQYKDVNDMVLAGMKVEDIQKLIDERTYSSMRAILEFKAWQK